VTVRVRVTVTVIAEDIDVERMDVK